MTRYEATFDTDWEDIDADTAAEHAYAIGVDEAVGEDNRDHLERIYRAMETAYAKSIVELAFKEGRRDAADAESETVAELWAELVEDDDSDVRSEDVPTGGRDGLPEALSSDDFLEEIDVDSTEAMDRPRFLDR